MVLTEVKRNEYINSAKQSDPYLDQSKGKNRYFRRMRQMVDKSTQELNRIDMQKLFSQGILDINLRVHGETNDYTVRISFGHFLAELHKEVMKNEKNFSLRIVTRALINAFNDDNVLTRCNCDDFQYRIAFHLSMAGGIAGEMETRPSNETNPNDSKGRGCKHIQAVLTNNVWLQRVGRVVYNYVNYMQEHYQGLYAEIIYPAIYEKEYDDVYQQELDLFDKKSLDQDENGQSDIIDTSNKWAREKGKFKKGNQSGWQFASDKQEEEPQDDQLSLDLNDEQPKEFDMDSEQ